MQQTHNFTYESVLAASQHGGWQIDDIIGSDKRLDFRKPFLPEALARTDGLAMLDASARLALNHIRAHGYLCMFGLVEEFILPFVADTARVEMEDDVRGAALGTFAAEEAKHIELFRRFRKEFQAGFGVPCAMIGPAEDISRAVLSHDRLGVALIILHIEWMTQRHYLESVRNNRELDPQFKSLLKHHWIEEAQHAKLDTLLVGDLAAATDARGIERGVLDYLRIVMLLDDGLAKQVDLDLEALALATGRPISCGERGVIAARQLQAMRWTFIGSGMTHPRFQEMLGALSDAARGRVQRMAPMFC